MRELAIRASWRCDLDELSALASRAERRGSVELLGVSDRSFAIAVAGAEPSGPKRRSSDLEAVVREWTSKPREGSQWEGIATDAAGRAFVLQEHAGRRRDPPHCS